MLITGCDIMSGRSRGRGKRNQVHPGLDLRKHDALIDAQVSECQDQALIMHPQKLCCQRCDDFIDFPSITAVTRHLGLDAKQRCPANNGKTPNENQKCGYMVKRHKMMIARLA